MLKITIITLGNKMPAWVDHAVNDFVKRLREGVIFTLIEIPLLRRGKSSDLVRITEKEQLMMAAAIPSSSYVIALDVTGVAYSSEQLASKLEKLQQITSHLCFLIGGPEGLTPHIITLSNEQWSMSKLTLPHTLVRIVLVEALYRAWSILQNHPYHK